MKSKTLPDVYDFEVQYLRDWLQIGQRPPVAAAKVLILAIKLNRQHSPWPPRAAIASHLGIALSTVDMVLSKEQARGRLHKRTETSKGAVKQWLNVVQHKYIVPSPELIAVVEAGERKGQIIAPTLHPSRRRRTITL